MSQFLLIHYHDFFTYYRYLATFYRFCINGAKRHIEKYPTGAIQHPKKYLKGAIHNTKKYPTGANHDKISLYRRAIWIDLL